MPGVLSCRHLKLQVPGRMLCGDVSVTFEPGQMWAILGRNGCGKTTLVHALAGLDRAEVSSAQVRETMLAHLAAMLDFYGPESGLKRFRKHAAKYISPYGLSAEQRERLLTSQAPEDFLGLLDSLAFKPDLIAV